MCVVPQRVGKFNVLESEGKISRAQPEAEDKCDEWRRKTNKSRTCALEIITSTSNRKTNFPIR